ncbi:hypothetical protein AVEN_141852-1 [Araneus ventricosus]|uniref:Uncharacterized protein n=1 Tax=Araneus ventricosus TaxID=182803 RepID=A0A4Y2L4M3_ARAVE|nr:hypothetical protein AVEN_141852-1 [Araneus ventricosus]
MASAILKRENANEITTDESNQKVRRRLFMETGIKSSVQMMRSIVSLIKRLWIAAERHFSSFCLYLYPFKNIAEEKKRAFKSFRFVCSFPVVLLLIFQTIRSASRAKSGSFGSCSEALFRMIRHCQLICDREQL